MDDGAVITPVSPKLFDPHDQRREPKSPPPSTMENIHSSRQGFGKVTPCKDCPSKRRELFRVTILKQNAPCLVTELYVHAHPKTHRKQNTCILKQASIHTCKQTHARMHLSIHTASTRTHKYIRAYKRAQMCVHIYVHHAHTCTHFHMCIQKYRHAYMHTHSYVYTEIYTHINQHVHTSTRTRCRYTLTERDRE
jgi:hypothetical protein